MTHSVAKPSALGEHVFDLACRLNQVNAMPHRPRRMEPPAQTAETIAAAQAAQERDRVEALARLLCEFSPDIPEAARHLRFDDFPIDVRDRYRRRAKMALGLVSTARDEAAHHAAFRAVLVALEHAGTVASPALAREIATAAVSVYLDVLALSQQAADPRRV